MKTVAVERREIVLPTFEPMPPDKNPMFLERRVYQGSSGSVYPLPFYNRISETSVERVWQAIIIENEFIEVLILPEIGGRIHAARDKTNGYDLFYRQSVIKPALVGLAGPWASGGVEFNWPQHHRPSTFMPVDTQIERHADGSATVWLSDHDPMLRMKGMHGVCLHPDKSLIELKMRAYNRTPHAQTFLWWANVATHVHEGYQSFFPTDVAFVADHAKRATSRFPLCDSTYYGVDYAARARTGVPASEVPKRFVPPHCAGGNSDHRIPIYAPNDLSWYANIPVPTSYMCLGSREDFSGGYDYKKEAGLIQISNHHISPGKKQWTWGNQEFGYTWDRNLTEQDGPYIELMLGVYTDNQPDFSHLQPGETKHWSVYWYPIQKIGPAQKANAEAALSFKKEGRHLQLGVAVTGLAKDWTVRVLSGAKAVYESRHTLTPSTPALLKAELPRATTREAITVTVADATGREVLRYQPRLPVTEAVPAPATEPPRPRDVASNDELFMIATHLSQYRHATRSPVPYLEEALRRDPKDSRCNEALGLWHARRGDYSRALTCYDTAIQRITSRNPNPQEGGAFYHRGLCLNALGRVDEAYDSLYKAVWNQAWQAAGYHALAEIDCRRGNWTTALDHIARSLSTNTDNLRARNLRARVLFELGRPTEAIAYVADTLKLDPLDCWTLYLSTGAAIGDTQTRIDLALDYLRAGFNNDADAVLAQAAIRPDAGTAPLLEYYRAHVAGLRGDKRSRRAHLEMAASIEPDYCFPARLEELTLLRDVCEKNPKDGLAHYYVGNLLYNLRRHEEALEYWEKAVALRPGFSTLWRNLGIGYFNVRHDAAGAAVAYERAVQANPSDARLIYERDQLLKRLGHTPQHRLDLLESAPTLVAERDDATIELASLYNHVGASERALTLLESRRFQPWEGGEGQALQQYVRTRLILGKRALSSGLAEEALIHFQKALVPPPSLGEAKHLLANQSDIFYWLGNAEAVLGHRREARANWQRASEQKGDFTEMSVRSYSELTYYSALATEKLGRRKQARERLKGLRDYALALSKTKATIDYFATSLPTMLLFDDDLQFRQGTLALFLRAQAELALGDTTVGRRHLTQVLRREPSHAGATDLLEETKR